MKTRACTISPFPHQQAHVCRMKWTDSLWNRNHASEGGLGTAGTRDSGQPADSLHLICLLGVFAVLVVVLVLWYKRSRSKLRQDSEEREARTCSQPSKASPLFNGTEEERRRKKSKRSTPTTPIPPPLGDGLETPVESSDLLASSEEMSNCQDRSVTSPDCDEKENINQMEGQGSKDLDLDSKSLLEGGEYTTPPFSLPIKREREGEEKNVRHLVIEFDCLRRLSNNDFIYLYF